MLYIPQVLPMLAQYKFIVTKSWEPTNGVALRLENYWRIAIRGKCQRIWQWIKENLSASSTWVAQSFWSLKHRKISSEFIVIEKQKWFQPDPFWELNLIWRHHHCMFITDSNCRPEREFSSAIALVVSTMTRLTVEWRAKNRFIFNEIDRLDWLFWNECHRSFMLMLQPSQRSSATRTTHNHPKKETDLKASGLV